jgi:hypothetical protein
MRESFDMKVSLFNTKTHRRNSQWERIIFYTLKLLFESVSHLVDTGNCTQFIFSQPGAQPTPIAPMSSPGTNNGSAPARAHRLGSAAKRAARSLICFGLHCNYRRSYLIGGRHFGIRYMIVSCAVRKFKKNENV